MEKRDDRPQKAVAESISESERVSMAPTEVQKAWSAYLSATPIHLRLSFGNWLRATQEKDPRVEPRTDAERDAFGLPDAKADHYKSVFRDLGTASDQDEWAVYGKYAMERLTLHPTPGTIMTFDQWQDSRKNEDATDDVTLTFTIAEIAHMAADYQRTNEVMVGPRAQARTKIMDAFNTQVLPKMGAH